MIWTLLRSTLLVVTMIWCMVTVMSMVYHRYLTHRSIALNKWVARVLTLILQGMAFAPPFTWVASHAYHHAYTDAPEDPYSSRVHGFWKVFFLTPLLVIQWKRRHGPAIVAQYTRGVPDRDFYAFVSQEWFCSTIALSFAAGFFGLFGRMGLVIYLLHVIGLYLLTGWINAGAHTVGSRPFDNSGVNRQGMIPILLNLWMAGEWLHNHHHHRPGSANFGLWGEIDTGYLACRFLMWCGLASVDLPAASARTPPTSLTGA